jgi:ABC-type methionine transport system permease subunit
MIIMLAASPIDTMREPLKPSTTKRVVENKTTTTPIIIIIIIIIAMTMMIMRRMRGTWLKAARAR